MIILGGLSFYEDTDGNKYVVGADSVPKKLGSIDVLTNIASIYPTKKTLTLAKGTYVMIVGGSLAANTYMWMAIGGQQFKNSMGAGTYPLNNDIGTIIFNYQTQAYNTSTMEVMCAILKITKEVSLEYGGSYSGSASLAGAIFKID